MRSSKSKSVKRSSPKKSCKGACVKAHKSHSVEGKVEKVKGFCRKSPRKSRSKKACKGSWVKAHKSHSAKGKVEKVKGYCKK